MQFAFAISRLIENGTRRLSPQQVILGLGMGERLSVSQEVKTIMRDTGTAHLMAISGLHIAFAALLAGGIIRAGQFLCPPDGFVGRFH